MDFRENFLCFLLLLIVPLRATESNFHSSRKGRFLIYPPTSPTRLQFIGGIGIPVEDLSFESITSGYVLKAEYFLPTMAKEYTPNYLKPQTIHRRSVNGTEAREGALERGSLWRTNTDDGNERSSNFVANLKSQQKNASVYRWIIYRGVEMMLNRAGFPGRACVLRSICEHAAVPLRYESGMLAEILHIILTPSASRDDFAKPSDREYFRAEILGRKSGNCELKYGECTSSPMDQISVILDLIE